MSWEEFAWEMAPDWDVRERMRAGTGDGEGMDAAEAFADEGYRETGE